MVYSHDPQNQVDAVVLGVGFSGLYMLYRLCEVRLVDVKASSIESIAPKGIRTADNEYGLTT
ncbi:hypothetical protein [Thalassobacillus devorans]|uniref:hypothetical protein n=1 Tax=Thalassobacillus devorans TaxID=279813 RepID=UPI000A1CB066|nr:hypothetical protein [Thalassobacillus devorans]